MPPPPRLEAPRLLKSRAPPLPAPLKAEEEGELPRLTEEEEAARLPEPAGDCQLEDDRGAEDGRCPPETDGCAPGLAPPPDEGSCEARAVPAPPPPGR